MKIHLKICPEREYNCKLDDHCRFKAKKEEYLQHLIQSHSSAILNVSENFPKIKEYLPDLELQPKIGTKNNKEELRENVNNILNEYNYNRDNLFNEPYDFNYNQAVSTIDRSFYRNYLFRRRLLNSESSKNQSEIENEDMSVHSDKTFSDNIKDRSTQRKTENVTTQQNSTNLFKYYYNDKKTDNEPFNYIDTVYNKFDPNTADEEDYKNLYQQLVSQNKLLKSEILDKIKKNDDNNTIILNDNNNEIVNYDSKKMEEEEKETEKNNIYKVSNKMNEIIGKMNRIEKGVKESTEASDKKMLPSDKTSSINSTLSLCLNNENK
jgi:hypothetical protein